MTELRVVYHNILQRNGSLWGACETWPQFHCQKTMGSRITDREKGRGGAPVFHSKVHGMASLSRGTLWKLILPVWRQMSRRRRPRSLFLRRPFLMTGSIMNCHRGTYDAWDIFFLSLSPFLGKEQNSLSCLPRGRNTLLNVRQKRSISPQKKTHAKKRGWAKMRKKLEFFFRHACFEGGSSSLPNFESAVWATRNLFVNFWKIYVGTGIRRCRRERGKTGWRIKFWRQTSENGGDDDLNLWTFLLLRLGLVFPLRRGWESF